MEARELEFGLLVNDAASPVTLGEDWSVVEMTC
jgi:hypothetical protein